ncbi:hypothetical protein [Grimontia marina]|uniref:Cell division inhibitor SulA n=1 Tax=Grimontia marina TaxID=646534 RepID=A0A128F6F5_9GAMM|nr:hypothetical protein [Grimontia marina]CZF82085.1 hypothetical protein GMA8713_02079 [Grimontia marina]
MKQSFAINQSVHHTHMTRSAVREHYARLAAGARIFHQANRYQNNDAMVSSNLVSVNIYQNNMSELAYLLRLVKSLAESHKWITLVAPPSNFSLSLFTKAGIQQSQIRIARPTATHDAKALMNKALASDTSAAVIGFGELSQFAESVSGSEIHTPGFVISGVPEQFH